MGQNGKKYISPSQYNTLVSCGKQYEFRYIEGLKIAPAWAMLRGRAVHVQRDKSFQQQIDTGSIKSLEEVKQIASDAVDNSFKGEVRIDEGETKESTKGKTKDDALALTEVDHRDFQSTIIGKAVEQRRTVEIGGLSRPILVITDLEAEGPGGGTIIRDAKTAAKTPNFTDEELKRHVQLISEAISFEASAGEEPEGIALDYLISTKVPKTKVFQTGPPTIEEVDRVIDKYGWALETIEAGSFAPNPTWWGCSKKFCGFYKLCKFWSGR